MRLVRASWAWHRRHWEMWRVAGPKETSSPEPMAVTHGAITRHVTTVMFGSPRGAFATLSGPDAT